MIELALLKEYFMLKNITPEDQKVLIYFATAYNKFGENNSWHQANVERFFSKDELLIGKNYWNFVCIDENGFDIVFDQYKTFLQNIKDSLTRIRNKYGCLIQAFACIFYIRKRVQLSVHSLR